VKLRIKGSSLRLRLTQGEIQQLVETGEVQEQVPFAANATLVYRLRRDSKISDITATYTVNLIEILIPERASREWCGSDRVTLEHSQRVPGGELRVTLEKDFACLAPRAGEDESDNFPHPQAVTGSPKC